MFSCLILFHLLLSVNVVHICQFVRVHAFLSSEFTHEKYVRIHQTNASRTIIVRSEWILAYESQWSVGHLLRKKDETKYKSEHNKRKLSITPHDEKRIHKPDSNNKWLTLVGCNNCSICIMWSHSKHSVINYCRDRNLINEQRQLINLEITYLVKLTTRNFRCNLYSIPILAHRICVYVRLYVETRLMRSIIHNNRHLLWYTYRN